MKPTYRNILDMLRESNYIEEQWDKGSLITANRAWKYIIGFDKLTPRIIKDTHAILMRGKDIGSPDNTYPIAKKYIGDFRDVPVWVGGKGKVLPKPVIEGQVKDLCEDINLLPPETLLMHIRFENIHPFIDGNGRIGRIIMNWHSVKRGENLMIFTASKKHEIYYPIFDHQDRHINKAIEYARKNNKNDYHYLYGLETRLSRTGN